MFQIASCLRLPSLFGSKVSKLKEAAACSSSLPHKSANPREEGSHTGQQKKELVQKWLDLFRPAKGGDVVQKTERRNRNHDHSHNIEPTSILPQSSRNEKDDGVDDHIADHTREIEVVMHTNGSEEKKRARRQRDTGREQTIRWRNLLLRVYEGLLMAARSATGANRRPPQQDHAHSVGHELNRERYVGKSQARHESGC